MAWEPDIGIQYNRNSSKDIISQPATLYTDSTSLTVGMTLYDNTGTDTGLTISAINQDGSFNIGSSTTTRTITFINKDTSHDYGTSITVNGETLSSESLYNLPSYTWTVTVGDAVTMNFDGSKNGFDGSITESSNENYIPLVAWTRENYTAVVTFTMPDEDLTFSILDEID